MLLIPAIDLRGGNAVRLQKGDYDRETVFSNDPVDVARGFAEAGAKRIHLVDLDGAREGRPVNGETIRRIVAAVDVPCELGGGLRDDEAVDGALALGVAYAIVGTRAVRDPDWFAALAQDRPDKIMISVDAENGLAKTAGWREGSSVAAEEIVRRVDELPLAGIVYTDIAKDGMMSGPNFDMTERLAKLSSHMVVASGGVSSDADVRELDRRGVPAAILGRAIYEGAIHLGQLVEEFS